jgi:predicted amidophosphoribosyltransferase
MHCQRCGAPVTFGTLCPQCLKLLNGNVKGYQVQQRSSTSERMRFLDNPGNSKQGNAN